MNKGVLSLKNNIICMHCYVVLFADDWLNIQSYPIFRRPYCSSEGSTFINKLGKEMANGI